MMDNARAFPTAHSPNNSSRQIYLQRDIRRSERLSFPTKKAVPVVLLMGSTSCGPNRMCQNRIAPTCYFFQADRNHLRVPSILGRLFVAAPTNSPP
jgi:hypothetical protein